MQRKAGQTLTPKRRFPGFDQPWSHDPLNKSLKERKDKNTNRRPVFSVSLEYGVVNQIEHLGRSFAATDTSNYNLGRQFDIVFTRSPLKAFPFGIVKQYKLEGEIALSPLYGVFKPINPHVGLIVETYFESPNRSKIFLSPLCQKGAKNTIQITNATFLSGRILLPQQDTEQGKIAACLDSINDLIDAEGKKLDALKSHKKGLTHQIFPCEGETQPRMRFPEFRDAPDWSSDSLGNTFDTSTGGTPDRTIKEYWNGNIPWIKTAAVTFNIITESDEFITNEGLRNSSAKIFPKNTVLIAMYGQGKTRGQIAMLGIKAATNQACAAVLPREGINARFVFMNLGNRYEELRSLSNSGGQENLSQGLIRALPFSFPGNESEQNKIADCLTFLDDIIAAQTQKLEVLKNQKKGLVQQLFPSLPEAEA